MLSFEIDPDELATPTLVEDTGTEADDAADVAEVAPVADSPTSEAARVLEVAAGTAGQLIADAETEAATLVTTAQAKVEEMLAALAEQKDALEAQIATLRNLESHHRSRMREHLTHQLSLLEGDAPVLPEAG